MIKQINDRDFFTLAGLYASYNLCLSTRHNISSSTSLLLQELAQPDALALGLYVKGVLRGFTLGKQHSKEIYTFTAMYIEPEYRYYMQKLFKASEATIKKKGYRAFISVSSTKEGINMHTKMGCNPIEIKYYKEL